MKKDSLCKIYLKEALDSDGTRTLHGRYFRTDFGGNYSLNRKRNPPVLLVGPSCAMQVAGRHFWTKGYCISTVSLEEEKVRKYVKWQQVKDKRME